MRSGLNVSFVPKGKEEPVTTHEDDRLGNYLTRTFESWRNARLPQENEWLRCLRAFCKINEDFIDDQGGLHDYIFVGSTLTKCIAAFSRISDALFKSESHWEINPTPIPEFKFNPDEYKSVWNEVVRRAENMTKEIKDLLIDADYEHYLKMAVMEFVILGSGCIKGATLAIREKEYYQRFVDQNTGEVEWVKMEEEYPAPLLSAPTVFNIYPDPDALLSGDKPSVFERHIVSRAQLSALKNDKRFDAAKIDKLLTYAQKGDHVDLAHESARRAIANNRRVFSSDNMYDLLEYWGQVSGYELIQSGFNHHDIDIKETDVYWCNIWMCRTETLYNRIFPLKKRVNPYNIFNYIKVPHRFWGFGVAFLNEETQLGINDTTRDLLDATAFAARPLAEVFTTMLKKGQDPTVISPNQVFLRDSGDPSVPAVRWLNFNAPIGQLAQSVELMRRNSDDATMLPQFSYGETSSEINQTMGGLSMQLGVAALPTKAIIKNIEDDAIKPVIRSMYDFVMKWSDNEDCKGDMNVDVRCSSVLLAKAQRTQQLMQFSNVAASNPMTAKFTDFKYLVKEIAKSLDIDPDKAIPEQLSDDQQPQPPQEDPITKAKVELIEAQIAKMNADITKVAADTAATNIKTQFGAIQTAAQIAINPALVPIGDSSLESAGYVDANGTPVANVPEQQSPIMNDGIPENTHPNFPANMPQPDQAALDPTNAMNVSLQKNNSMSPYQGLGTVENEVAAR
jgi:hypothetical protein